MHKAGELEMAQKEPEYIILNCEACKKPVVKMHRGLLEHIRKALHYSGDNNPHFYHTGCPGGLEGHIQG